MASPVVGSARTPIAPNARPSLRSHQTKTLIFPSLRMTVNATNRLNKERPHMGTGTGQHSKGGKSPHANRRKQLRTHPKRRCKLWRPGKR